MKFSAYSLLLISFFISSISGSTRTNKPGTPTSRNVPSKKMDERGGFFGISAQDTKEGGKDSCECGPDGKGCCDKDGKPCECGKDGKPCECGKDGKGCCDE